MRKPPLGDQELEVLRYVAEHAPASVGEVAEGFGAPRGLARTTIQTVMERLCKKGYLRREPQDGVFRFSPPVPQEDVLQGLVRDFVQKTLRGSLSPFMAYLANTDEVSNEQLAELQRQVEQLRIQREGKEQKRS
jgi:predicted transcriptional regulator